MADIFLPQILKQTAVYWAPKEISETGSVVYEAPVELRCRWEDRQVMYLNNKAQMVVSRSIVFVDRDLLVNGVLWLGTLEDLNDPDDPSENLGFLEIMSYNKIPDIKAKKFVRKAIG